MLTNLGFLSLKLHMKGLELSVIKALNIWDYLTLKQLDVHTLTYLCNIGSKR